MTLKVSVGILAYNEAEIIEATLSSLYGQSIFSEDSLNCQIEIIVIANGCQDETAEIARKTLKRLSKSSVKGIEWKVVELVEPGKSNAWNLFVHDFSNPCSEYLILMDADINFLNGESLLKMVAYLEKANEAWISTAKRFKDISSKKNKTLFDKLSLQASSSVEEVYKHSICGQLYCARSSVLRAIWMPKGLAVEDGFLRAMVTTDCFTSKEIPERIVMAPGASYEYAAYKKIVDLVNHEKRIVVGDIINFLLFDYFWENCNLANDAGELVRQKNVQNPDWLEDFVREKVAVSDSWLISKKVVFRRFTRAKNYSSGKFFVLFPFICIAFCLDLLVFWQANQVVRSEKGVGFW